MRSYSSLISDYKPDFFYFELVDCLRKAIFTGALLFASSVDAATQKQRKQATEKRNALALEHQRSREAQRMGSSADSN